MNSQISFKNQEITITGNTSGVINQAEGALYALVISKDQDTSNAAKSVTVTCDMADGFSIAFGPFVIGNTPAIFLPRKQAIAADLTTLIAGVYDQWYLCGKVTVAVTAGDAGDITRVKLVLVP